MGAATVIRLVLLLTSTVHTWGFKWPINSVYGFSKGKFTFSELYMYSHDDAPFGVTSEDTLWNIMVHLDVHFSVPSAMNTSIVISAFHVDDSLVKDPIDMNALSRALTNVASDSETCSNYYPKEVSHLKTEIYHPEEVMPLSDLGANAELTPQNEYQTRIKFIYKVPVSGLYSIIVEVCNDAIGETVTDGTVKMRGEVAFQNPYGYLSGIYYGYLPFEGTRACIFGLFFFIYAILLYLHRHTLLITNWCILAVVFLCTIEAVLWFAAYLDMNENGEPYCCPFPNLIIASMIFQVFRRSTSRCLLLSICLGLGVARPDLTKREVILMAILTVLYFIASMTVNVVDVVSMSNLDGSSEDNIYWELPTLILDIVFLIWIYVALIDTMTDLQISKQSMKLELYNRLGIVIGFFGSFVTVVTLILMLARYGLFPWPWRLYFVQTVLWELLNLGVLVAVSIIWRPSERAALLAHSLQLTTDEYTEEAFDDDVEEDLEDLHKRVKSSQENGGYDDDDCDDEFASIDRARSPSPRSKQFEKNNVAAFSDVSYEEDGDLTNDFSVDACVIKGDIEMSSQSFPTYEEEEEDDEYDSLPTVAG